MPLSKGRTKQKKPPQQHKKDGVFKVILERPCKVLCARNVEELIHLTLCTEISSLRKTEIILEFNLRQAAIQGRALVLTTGCTGFPGKMSCSPELCPRASAGNTNCCAVSRGWGARETAHRPREGTLEPTQQLNHPYTVLHCNPPEITLKWATSTLPFHKTNPRAPAQEPVPSAGVGGAQPPAVGQASGPPPREQRRMYKVSIKNKHKRAFGHVILP